MQPSGIITLTTDFGQTDSYVGVMKGVILGVNRNLHIVDITHAITPQNVQQAAYVLQTFPSYFPPGTLHVVVVDPGVGSQRCAIALQTPEATFVAPDNGLLRGMWHEAQERWGAEQLAVHELTERQFWLPDLSNTFHGRDIFAPVAAHLASGTPITALGPRLEAPVEAALQQPTLDDQGALEGRIIHVDHFGNCITNIQSEHVAQVGFDVVIEIAAQRLPTICRTYADGQVGALIALYSSSGRLELAVRNGSAARLLGAAIGDVVRIWRK